MEQIGIAITFSVAVVVAACLVACGGGGPADSGGETGGASVSGVVVPPVGDAGLGLTACVASGLGRDYQVGPNAGQLASLADVPWESLGAGDTVRIFYRATPYAGKFILAAQATAAAPARICGVKGSNGERPVITAQNAVTRLALANAYGTSGSTASQYNEARGILYVGRMNTQVWASYPRYLQIDGLKFTAAHPDYRFTDSFGVTRNYIDFGACVWIDRGQNVVIADNEFDGCSQGIFSRSTADGDFAVTKNFRIAGNIFTNSGIANDVHMHASYVQSLGVVYEFNRYGPLRAGASGNSIKDRSAGAVIRYNRIEDGAHAIDLVEAEDWGAVAMAEPAYRKTFVYGNQIKKNGQSGSTIHYGGDHAGSESAYRKGTLYFFNNSVQLTGGDTAKIFQLSTTEETAEVWNNVFFTDTSTTLGFRQSQDNAAGYTAGGILNLGRNWITSGWYDGDLYHTVTGQLNGTSNLLTGPLSSLPLDASTWLPLGGSALVDSGTAPPAAAAAAAAYPVLWQLDSSFRPVARTVQGYSIDIGARER
jgi:hypothetical protein